MDIDEVREHHSEAVADADLVVRSRSGDVNAFGELWRRHYRAGVTVARNMTSSLDPDDLVQEAYARIYRSIVAGGGPTGSFRAYLFTSIRNIAALWGRARRETAYDELDDVVDPATDEHEREVALDRRLTTQAFRSLPTRWQEVLWYSEIEGMKPAEIGPLLGMKATAVAQLTFRAREGLREAWIQAHLRAVVDGSLCQWTIEHLGAYARHNLGRRDLAKLERHLSNCVHCSLVASEAREVSSRLAVALLPLALGAVGGAGSRAAGPGGAGAATLPGWGGARAGARAPGGAGAAPAGATATSAGVAGAAGSAVTGIGAMSGLAAAGLAVVTVVTASAVFPSDVAAPSNVPVSAHAPASAPPLLDDLLADASLPNGPDPADIPALPDAGGERTEPSLDTGATSRTAVDPPAAAAAPGDTTQPAAGSTAPGTTDGQGGGIPTPTLHEAPTDPGVPPAEGEDPPATEPSPGNSDNGHGVGNNGNQVANGNSANPNAGPKGDKPHPAVAQNPSSAPGRGPGTGPASTPLGAAADSVAGAVAAPAAGILADAADGPAAP